MSKLKYDTRGLPNAELFSPIPTRLPENDEYDLRDREHPCKRDFAYYNTDGELVIIEKKSKNAFPADMFLMIGYISKLQGNALIVKKALPPDNA